MTPTPLLPVLLLPGLLLAACTRLIGPMVGVAPAPGRPQAAFEADRRSCMAVTDRTLQPVADSLNRAAGSAGQVVANSDRVQVMYDDAFGRCMAARGNVVAAAASDMAGAPSALGSSTTVSRSLSDANTAAAKQSLAPLVAEFRRACDDASIASEARNVLISPGVAARVVTLTQPGGGSCFGQPGTNAYLVAKGPRGWERLLSAEPGSIEVRPTRAGGHADLELASLGACRFRYRWDGHGYVGAGSASCGPMSRPPTLRSLSQDIRGRQ